MPCPLHLWLYSSKGSPVLVLVIASFRVVAAAAPDHTPLPVALQVAPQGPAHIGHASGTHRAPLPRGVRDSRVVSPSPMRAPSPRLRNFSCRADTHLGLGRTMLLRAPQSVLHTMPSLGYRGTLVRGVMPPASPLARRLSTCIGGRQQ